MALCECCPSCVWILVWAWRGSARLFRERWAITTQTCFYLSLTPSTRLDSEPCSIFPVFSPELWLLIIVCAVFRKCSLWLLYGSVRCGYYWGLLFNKTPWICKHKNIYSSRHVPVNTDCYSWEVTIQWHVSACKVTCGTFSCALRVFLCGCSHVTSQWWVDNSIPQWWKINKLSSCHVMLCNTV